MESVPPEVSGRRIFPGSLIAPASLLAAQVTGFLFLPNRYPALIGWGALFFAAAGQLLRRVERHA